MSEVANEKVPARGKAAAKRNGTHGPSEELHKKQILSALRALKRGDFEYRLPEDLGGLDAQICDAFNDIAQGAAALRQDALEVRQSVGVEGKTRLRLPRGALRGGWRDYVYAVNELLDDLTTHHDDVVRVITAVSRGDLSQTIAVNAPDHPLRGDFLSSTRTVNGMVQRLASFGGQVTLVAHEVGVLGKLGAQARVEGVSGAWKEVTDSVNRMASNLTTQVREIARVTTAVAQGDLTKTINIEVQGEILELKNTINTMVSQLGMFTDEVTRVSREVGTEGVLGGQAQVRGVSGVWRELTENVNSMAQNLTDQVRNIAEVSSSIAAGDLSKKITVEVQGEILELKNTINTMVDQLSSFADEVTRVSREVGTDGILGGQAKVKGVSGVWAELTENVNFMANNLTDQVRNIAEVVTAIAEGDLSRKITVDARGEILALKDTINATVDKLSSFSSEVTRVARLVGTEGTLGVQAEVRDVSGVWRELTENVNLMGRNLTDQVRDIADVTTAVANGDLSRKITVEVKGEILTLKNTINAMVDSLSSFADEVTRMAREVGTEGVLGGQAVVHGVSGIWKELTLNVNSMASNLTNQVRNIAGVARAVAQGDLSRKITVNARGEVLDLKITINDMVDQLNAFGAEVTRVAREVGVEGKLGGQAAVEGVRGTWKELTDNVNLMASNLTNQVRDISRVSTAIAKGDLGSKVTVEVRGEFLDLKNTINTMVDQLSSFADEVTRVARDVGVEGKLGGQAEVRGVSGIWKELTDNVNLMASNLTNQVRDIATVTTAVANGDLSRKIKVEVRGEILELKNTINTMVDQLSSFADEVTRVAREVGTDGILGGLAEVRGVSGTWRELTDNVNVMAQNLTEQVRGIARVVTAVANGDLKQKLTLNAQGEIATLVETINNMIVTLSTFADQVTSVARDVGVEGKLGGQADVPGAAGIWSDLTNNVNELAGNLTRQVRAIGDVATAVTKGDLTRSITVEARGELALLKDNLNKMILTLAETTRVNKDQDWLKTNLARFTRMLQGQRALISLAEQVLSELAPVMDAQHGTFYTSERNDGDVSLKLCASYAYAERHPGTQSFALGQGLVGQAASDKRRILLSDVPPDYVRITSGLGEATPGCLVVAPISFEGEVKGVIELAAFRAFSPIQLAFLEQLIDSLGIVIATIEATMRTDELLRQSQSLTEELQTQQEELQQTNEELEEKARQLTEQKAEVEKKNREVGRAKQELEEKAEQLALTSRYKSQFLANMSHELRTPLNSLLILSRQLADNRDQNLSDRQVEYARTIHHSGTDLLSLINEILDLAKIESGTIAVDVGRVWLDDLRDYVDRGFRQMASEKGLSFQIEMSPDLPEALTTDDMRLKQVLRNLLANALKFTETGGVKLQITTVHPEDFMAEAPTLRGAKQVMAFSIVDTGIGIAKDKQKIVFEAFQQADGGTSRKFGGTGLGLAISREIARLLGGELHLSSVLGEGSVFTLYLPSDYERGDSTLEQRHPRPEGPRKSSMKASLASSSRVQDDRADLDANSRLLLVIEDDETFARTLLDLAREIGFQGVVATTGSEALELSRRLKPAAITLDVGLPDMDGWVVLDQLKHDVATQHIPVHIISASDENRRGLQQGALAFLQKPVTEGALKSALDQIQAFLDRKVKQLLVVEDDETLRGSLCDLLTSSDVEVHAVGSAEAAIQALESANFDCAIVDLKLLDASGFDLMRTIKQKPELSQLPIVVYTGQDLTPGEESKLRQLASSNIVKGARSPERLLQETALFLHRVESSLSPANREMLQRLNHVDPALAGKKALIVDDDVRNVFATTALLEQHQMIVSYAENGRQALTKLNEEPGVDVVLMDIMMPEMDGYEATRQIRQQARFAKLPVIALTAKAMKGDREKCIAAGASDYITKPVDSDQMLSLLRVWLYR